MIVLYIELLNIFFLLIHAYDVCYVVAVIDFVLNILVTVHECLHYGARKHVVKRIQWCLCTVFVAEVERLVHEVVVALLVGFQGVDWALVHAWVDLLAEALDVLDHSVFLRPGHGGKGAANVATKRSEFLHDLLLGVLGKVKELDVMVGDVARRCEEGYHCVDHFCVVERHEVHVVL